MKNSIIFLLLLIPIIGKSQDGIKPIIDVHLHGYTEQSYFVAPSGDGTLSPPSFDEFKSQIESMMKKYNIVKAVNSGGVYDASMNDKIIPGIEVYGKPSVDTVQFEKLVQEGKIKVFGEVGAQYVGLTLSDPIYEPYLRICEQYQIPVALHTGGGPPGVAYREAPKFRLSLGDPLLIEDVIIKYPKLKIYIMHAGGNYYENTLTLMHNYEHVYSDLGILLWEEGMVSVWTEDFLRKAKKANLLDRIMYGSDPMVWPHAIEKSIQQLDSYEFLTEEDKRNIFYYNAVEFLNLKE
ncbi:MAG: amidohydrolase family protein [Fulvivirga sp.]|uniref:amidohydrolase family protein n=1 Tax=Fulvivirga sp. TaxID=1931237 RepID=UPI0032EADC8F